MINEHGDGTGLMDLPRLECQRRVSPHIIVVRMRLAGLTALILQCMKGRFGLTFAFTGRAAVLGKILFSFFVCELNNNNLQSIAQ